MAVCKLCCIEVLNETEICPLCRSVLEKTETMENMYPNVRERIRGLRLAARIYLFCALVIFAVLALLDWHRETQIWWSVLAGLALLYGYLLLRYAIAGKSGYRGKVMVLSILAVLLAVAADFVVGYRGWSVDYVLPGGILALDGVVVGCMACNPRRWYSYILWQLLLVLCSLIPVALYFWRLEHHALMAFLPPAVSVSLFFGALIIGGRSARQELVRRFHF